MAKSLKNLFFKQRVLFGYFEIRTLNCGTFSSSKMMNEDSHFFKIYFVVVVFLCVCKQFLKLVFLAKFNNQHPLFLNVPRFHVPDKHQFSTADAFKLDNQMT